MNALRRLAVLVIVVSFCPPVGATSSANRQKPRAAAPSASDAAAVQASLLAFQERFSALRKRKIKLRSDVLGAREERMRAAGVRATRRRPGAKVSALLSTRGQLNGSADLIPHVEPQDVIALPTLERLVEQAPEMRLALSSERYSSAKIASLRRGRSPEMTLSTSAGRYRELVTDTLVREYTGADLRLGVRVPLFGASAQRGAMSQLGDELMAKQFDVDEARLSIVRELRERYVDYLTSMRKLDLTKKYLTSEPEVTSAVALRVRAGLSLQGEGLQALAGYNVAKENTAHFGRDASAALSEMRRLTDRRLPDFQPVEPALTAGCQTQAQFVRATLDASPGLSLLREQLAESRRFAARPVSPLRGSMTVSQGVIAQQGAPTVGRSTAVGFDLALPLDSAGAVAAERDVYTARADEIAARLKYETEHERAAADDAWNGIREAELEVHVAQSRVGTSRELTREGLLRYGSLAGNTVENLQTSRLTYYRSMLDQLDAEAELAKRRIVAISPSGGCAPGATVRLNDGLGPSGDRPSGNAFRVYAWNSRQILDGDWNRSEFWDRFTNAGIRRLMLSLNASQIGEAGAPQLHDRLQRFIAAGTVAGVNVDLLLGEPHWILSDQRNRLVSIVHDLRDVPFHALQLDIEPSQISAETRLSANELTSDLVETLRAVAAVSPWPLSLSANYRDFTDRSDGVCYACALKSSGVNEIVLMTYVANPDRVADLVRPIFRSAPAMSFAVAQSVESSLSSQESYRTATRPEFLSSMSRLMQLLDLEPNFSGIAVQSYQDYTAMQP